MLCSRVDWNDLFSSIPFLQILENSSHFLTNFAVNLNHENTIVPQFLVLSSSARDLCRAEQHFVHTNMFSVQTSKQTVFTATLNLPGSTTKK